MRGYNSYQLASSQPLTATSGGTLSQWERVSLWRSNVWLVREGLFGRLDQLDVFLQKRVDKLAQRYASRFRAR